MYMGITVYVCLLWWQPWLPEGFPLSDLPGLVPAGSPVVGNATRVVADMSTCNLLLELWLHGHGRGVYTQGEMWRYAWG